MIKEAIDRVLALAEKAKGEVIEIEGRKYLIHGSELKAIKTPIIDSPFTINTLTGLGDYLTDNPDDIDVSKVIIEVSSPTKVIVTSVPVDDWKRRESYLISSHAPKPFPFGRDHDIESFIIGLQAYFVQDETTAKLLLVASGIVDDGAISYSDDGMSQQVTAKTGIARISNVTIPNPVTLAPYRTFTEIAQPESKFIFRIKKTDSGPKCTLHEAEGNVWELEAIKRIRDWLRVHVPEGTAILA